MSVEQLIPAATVLLLREGGDGPEVLMLRRNSKIAFGGMWVFPGGRVDDHELDPADVLGSARRAAVREADEETGLAVAADALHTWSYWEPPAAASMPTTGPRRRFSTWFFAAAAPEGEVVIDDGEIKDHLWLSPTQALAMRDEGEIELVPPTWITLHQLAHHRSLQSAMDDAAAREPERFVTRPLPGKPVTLAWHGDAAYESGEADAPGDRHRLVLDPAGWVYHRS